MKKHYIKPSMHCHWIQVGNNLLLQDSFSASVKRETEESLSRRRMLDYWDDDDYVE